MTTFRVVGVDPSLTATGLVVLQSEKANDYRVAYATTVRTTEKTPMLERLDHLRQGTDNFLWGEIDNLDDSPTAGKCPFEAIVIEDPTRQHGTRTKRNSPGAIALMGLGVGVVLGAVLEFMRSLPDSLTDRTDLPALAFLDVEEWMPRQLRGNLSHIMAKAELVNHLRNRIAMPARHTEHELMAAGVARYWVEQQRQAERIAGARKRITACQ